MRQESIQKKKNGIKQDISKSYNQFKEFEGEKYTGMKVGRTHKWYYDKGECKEKGNS
jgi:adenosine deaminase